MSLHCRLQGQAVSMLWNSIYKLKTRKRNINANGCCSWQIEYKIRSVDSIEQMRDKFTAENGKAHLVIE